MDSFLQRLFHDQVWTQCKFATFAYDDLVERIPTLNAEKGPSEEVQALAGLPLNQLIAESGESASERALRIWCPIQSFLAATANISKILWGSDPAVSSARSPLRQALKVSDASPLRSRNLRENFEQFDARIDTWWGCSSTHGFVDMNFEHLATVMEGLPEEQVFRDMDLYTGDVVFWGQRYNLPSLNIEIRRVMAMALRGAAGQLSDFGTASSEEHGR